MSTARIVASAPRTASARRQPTTRQIDLFLSHISDTHLTVRRPDRDRVARIKAAVNSLLDISYGNEAPFNIASALATLESFREREIQSLQDQARQIEIINQGNSRRENVARSLELLIRDFAVTLRKDLMSVSVGNVKIRHNGLLHDLGDFTIKIRARTTHEGNIRYLGTKKVGANHHPHINRGSACYGSSNTVRDYIRACLREGELYDCVLFLKDFLHSYNEDGPYANIRMWQERYCEDCGELSSNCSCESN